MTIKSKLSDKDRNVLCPCGSQLKQKDCHNDPVKLQLCNKVAQMYMMRLVQEERKKKGIDPYAYTCEKCGRGTDEPRPSEFNKLVLVCPDPECGSTCLKKYVPPEPEKKEEPKENKSIILEG